MKKWTSISMLQLVAALAGVGLVVFVAILFRSEATVENVLSPKVAEAMYLATSTLPLRVSGVVEAADSVVVYAQAAGVVTELTAREGALVEQGGLLSVQSTPVANAQVALAAAERDLSLLQQGLAVETAVGGVEKATVAAYSADEIARLRFSGNDNRVQEASDALRVALTGAANTAVAGISYVDAQRPLFTSTGLEEYESVTTELYGQMPDYFDNGLRTSGTAVDATAILKTLRADAALSSSDVLVLSSVLGTQLQSLHEVLQTAESDVFEDLSAGEVAEYLGVRQEVVAALQSVVASTAAFQQVADTVLEDAALLDQSVAITALDESVARVTSRYTSLIESQTAVVGSAAVGVAEAARSLGVVRAPFSGRVGEVYASVGEYVTPGAPLMSLAGNGAREVEVTVPATFVPFIKIGTSFVHEGETIGTVSRVGGVVTGGRGVVVIALQTDVLVGATVTGQLQVRTDDVFVLPRKFVFFDVDGPYLTYTDGEVSRIEIVYDAGAKLYVTVSAVKVEALVPAISISL
ncbi:MAG: HlyD family efflux transporter periplasmic adaptor subunit [Candidatus Nomurabacteria bacterium]|nr:MAG: HlyD family efflux transporter periplasmic adaptor subunit [Candidatus Nomurabacteria bacterium]